MCVPGSDVVDWLYHRVEGFTDRREARKYASNLLKAGYIRHTVTRSPSLSSATTFLEMCVEVSISLTLLYAALALVLSPLFCLHGLNLGTCGVSTVFSLLCPPLFVN